MTEIDKKKFYPVDKDGNMLDYDGLYYQVADWKPTEPFVAQLSFSHYEKGRSSLRFILVDSATNRQWSMMANSIDLFVNNSVNGRILGKWSTVKRGANYGLILEEVL